MGYSTICDKNRSVCGDLSKKFTSMLKKIAKKLESNLMSTNVFVIELKKLKPYVASFWNRFKLKDDTSTNRPTRRMASNIVKLSKNRLDSY